MENKFLPKPETQIEPITFWKVVSVLALFLTGISAVLIWMVFGIQDGLFVAILGLGVASYCKLEEIYYKIK
jgi:hypothetical protein